MCLFCKTRITVNLRETGRNMTLRMDAVGSKNINEPGVVILVGWTENSQVRGLTWRERLVHTWHRVCLNKCLMNEWMILLDG